MAGLPGADVATPTLWQLTRYFLGLGTYGFGGPIALTGAMQRDLVERRRWISPADFQEGLALAQLAPGPLAAQLAMYLGYLVGGTPGALVIAVAFIGPSLLMVWGLSIAYVTFGGLAALQPLLLGVSAGVVGLLVRSAWRLSVLTMQRDRFLWIVAAAVALITAWLERELVSLFLLAGCLTMVRAGHATAPAASPALLLMPFTPPMSEPVSTSLGELFWFFAKAGAVVFGSGLAIVPFLYGGTVQEYGWLNDRQFLDAVAVAMVTPGPVVITVGFIGYLVRGDAGLLAAAAGVFLPVFLFVILPAPYFRRAGAHPRVRAFVTGVTAAATGAIAGAAWVLAGRALVDHWSVAIALASLVLVTARRVPDVLVVALGAAAGWMVWPH